MTPIIAATNIIAISAINDIRIDMDGLKILNIKIVTGTDARQSEAYIAVEMEAFLSGFNSKASFSSSEDNETQHRVKTGTNRPIIAPINTVRSDRLPNSAFMAAPVAAKRRPIVAASL